jgi:hypothetical protein
LLACGKWPHSCLTAMPVADVEISHEGRETRPSNPGLPIEMTRRLELVTKSTNFTHYKHRVSCKMIFTVIWEQFPLPQPLR